MTIGKGITVIPARAFYSCDFEGSLIIGENVVTISDYAFYKCEGFTGNLIIPDKVETIGKDAFLDCTEFKGYLSIGINVKSIDQRAFATADNRGIWRLYFSKIYCKATTPPEINSSTFGGSTYPSYLSVPTGTKETYATADYWNLFYLIEEVEF